MKHLKRLGFGLLLFIAVSSILLGLFRLCDLSVKYPAIALPAVVALFAYGLGWMFDELP